MLLLLLLLLLLLTYSQSCSLSDIDVLQVEEVRQSVPSSVVERLTVSTM